MKSLLNKPLPGNRSIQLYQYLYNWRLMLVEGEYTVLNEYCYNDLDAAVLDVSEWDGEGDPARWYKHPLTGRFRTNTEETAV